MKKFYLAVAIALLSIGTAVATVPYCQEPITAADGDALLSLKHISANSYEVELVAEGDMVFTAAYNINCGVNQTDGAGIGMPNDSWVISADGKTATFEFTTSSETSVPTNLYGNYMCFGKTGGTTARDLVEFNLDAIVDIDWTATCAAGPEDTEAPVMGTATVASTAFASVTLDVTATDNVGVRRYHVVTTPAAINGDITPANGQIVLKGLAANTTYSIVVTAKDAAGNVSANSATVSATTKAYPAPAAAPAHAQANVRSIYSDTYTSALAHDFGKEAWGSAAPEIVTIDANNQYLVYSTATTKWIAWGNNSEIGDDNTIVAAEGYNDGTNIGLDISGMQQLHVDIWVDAECVSAVITINDDRLAELGTLTGAQWNSLDLPLSALTEDKLNNLRWLKFDGINGVDYCFIDNVYAWKEQGSATQLPVPTQETNSARKIIRNGQLIILHNGVEYNILGAQIQ